MAFSDVCLDEARCFHLGKTVQHYPYLVYVTLIILRFRELSALYLAYRPHADARQPGLHGANLADLVTCFEALP